MCLLPRAATTHVSESIKSYNNNDDNNNDNNNNNNNDNNNNNKNNNNTNNNTKGKLVILVTKITIFL